MASKSFQVSIDFIGNISDLQSKIKQITGEISKIGATSGGVQIQKQFEQLVKTVTDLQTRASQPIGSKAEFNKLAGEVSKANMTYGQLMGTIERLQSLGGAKLLEFLPKDQQNNIKQATQAVKDFEEAQKAAQKAMGKKSKDQTDYSNLQSLAQSAAQKVEELEIKWKKAISAKDRYFKKENVTGKEKELASLESREKDLVTQSKRKAGLSETQAGELNQVRNRISEIKAELASIKADPLVKSAEEATAALNKAKDASNKLNNDVKNFKISDDGVKQYEQAFEQLKQKAAQLGVQVSDIGSVDNVQTLLNRLNQLESDGFIEGAQAAQQYANTIRSILDPAFKQMETGMNGVNQSWSQFMTAQEDMSMLQNRLKYFFSLTNSIQLLKRTITSAMNTVKELDAVMTETAVVTDFTVGDMWNKLPEYADQASALGASIKDLYSATTLYYQQGLNSEQAMSVGVETMKMARIAGMDAAEATKAMTAALRGFNMEIDETSATRINDVYSELAAITAADTEQIATAMSKTASIANSANMEFETTAALLAQIIETTQEAPETAGTAMKTIIARFTEVKKLFDEGILSGEDSEGEAIEINKIDAALRTVGISLTDFLKGQKGIDDIFLELASKWDTLDLATQRYIATTAAGSRQQSRFIAMMSNYDRTMELVTAANNSAGASQEQFDKTLDSMEAKLQKLKNAWNEFTMGLANNEILKGSIDVLTGLLETINKLTDALSGGSGLGKSIINFMTVIGALKGGKALLAGGFGQIGTWMGIEKKQQLSSQKELNAWQRAQKYSQEDIAAGKQSGFRGFVDGIFGTREKLAVSNRFNDSYLRQLAKEQRAEARYQQHWADIYLGMSTDKENIENIDINEKFAQNAMDAAGTANSAAKAYENLAIKIKAAKEITPELKAEMDALGITEEQITQYANIQAIGFQQMGAAALLAGGALGLLANAFDEMGNNNAVEFCQKLSTTLTGLGGTLTMLPMLFGGTTLALEGTTLGVKTATGAFTSFGISVWAALGWAAAAVAVIWLLVKGFQAIHAASPEGKLEAATEAANDAAEAAENAAQAYEHLASALNSISGKSAALENLAVGTTEWKNAVQELNGEVLDLVEQYPELAKFVDTSKGYLSFTDKEIGGKTVDDVLETYQDNKFKAQSASAAAKLQKQQAQQAVDFQNLKHESKLIKTRELTDEEKAADIIYGKGTIAGISTTQTDKEGTDEIARAIVNGEHTKYMNEDGTFQEDSKFAYLEDVNSEAFTSLKKYGEGLIAADATTKVFADSLKSNALMISEVSEEQKSNMMNFLDSEQVNSQVDDMLNTITTNWTKLDERQQYKQDYADIMGYEYDKSKDRFLKEGQEVKVSEESIHYQMAGIKVQENLNTKMQNLDRTLNLIDDNAKGLPGTFERMTEKGEGAALTFNDLQQIQERTDEQLISELYKDESLGLSNIYETEEEFVQFMRNSVKLGQAQMDQATKNLETINMSDYITEDMNLDIGQTKNVSDLLYEAVVQSGLDKGKELADNFKKGLEEESEGKKFAEALGMIDSSNIDSIKKLSEYLTDLDYTGTVNVDQLEQEIIEATNASKKFTLDNLKEEIGSVQELAKNIKGRDETNVIYTKEERDELVKNGIDKGFFVSSGKDEFAYIGESNEQLVAALQANTAALLDKTEKQIQEAAQKSESWGKLQETDPEIYGLLQGIAEGTIKPGYDNIDSVKTAMESAGIAVGDLIKDGRYIEGVLNIMKDRIASEYADFGSTAAQMTNQNNLQNYYQDGTAQLAYSSMTGQQILNTATQIDPNTGKPVVNQQGQEISSQVLESKLAQQEGGRAEAESTYEALVKENQEWSKHNNLVKAAVADAAEYEKKMTKLADTIEENADALTDSKKGTREYQRALDKITDAAKKAFGDNITEEFIEENIDLFKEFAKGSKSAVEGIRDKMVESFDTAENRANGTFSAIQSAASALDGTTFDIYGHADASQIFSELAAVMGSAEEAAAVLESLGYTVTWEITSSTVDAATGMVLNNYRAVVTNTGGNVAGSRGGGGGGGGGGSEESWENPYDKLYNLTEKINKSIREREQLERRYQRLIDRRIATAAELQRNSQAEIESLKEQAEYQQQMIEGRRKMMQEEMDENSDLQKYATIDKETGQITINWDLINSVTDEEEGAKIEEYISNLEELRDSMLEAQDALEEIEDSVWEIEERGREEYLEFEDRIKEALVEVRQKEIDTLEEINDSINDTNDKLLDSIQQSIDKIRQDRENEKTEEDLQEKQRQLAYLEQDTSGANAMKILELQEEIRQGQEDYTDTLIDQKISELQEQNDKAAEQREKQITLLQNQLDWEIESGRIWAEVDELLKEGLNPQGGLIRGSKLEQILKSGENWKGLSSVGQMDWMTDLETMIAESMNWRMNKGQLENLHESKAGQEITFKDANGRILTGKVDEKGQVWTSKDTYYKDIYQWIDGTYHTTEKEGTKYVAPKPAASTSSSGSSSGNTGGEYYYSGKKKNKDTPKIEDERPDINEIKKDAREYSAQKEAERAAKEEAAKKEAVAEAINTGFSAPESTAGAAGQAIGSWIYGLIKNKFATGGLADFTGPAWLDGTKSRPELVLNQRDTQNFIQLKDILSSVMSRNFSNTQTSTENNGDITYDIDINVETMGSDYDLEQVAGKIKSMINEDARYRNNNAISLKR